MGLDMYLQAEKYEAGLWNHMATTPDGSPSPARRTAVAILSEVGLTPEDVHPGGLTVSVTAAYWRKSNQIHSWFVREVQNGTSAATSSPSC